MQDDILINGHRLAALRDTGWLDGERQPVLDGLTRDLADAVGAPVALISLVDGDRQFFAGSHGLGEPWVQARETPLSHSFCKHVVRDERALIVDDATRHHVVWSNLAVRDLGVIAYAGIPLRLADGHVLGTICAVDAAPRVWTAKEIATIEAQAAVVVEHLSSAIAARRADSRDPLTGLADKAALTSAADRATSGGHSLALLAIAVDGLDVVNGALGFRAGDRLLRTIAQRLTRALPSDAVAARIDGDTFAVLRDPNAGDGPLALAAELQAAIADEPFALDAAPHTLHARINVAVSDPEAPETGDALLERARGGLRRIQAMGRLTPGADVERLDVRASVNERGFRPFAEPMSAGDLTVAYAPIADGDGEPGTVEAIVSWRHPESGDVADASQLLVAESDGRNAVAWEWLLQQAAAAVAGARASNPAAAEIRLALRVREVQLAQANFSDIVAGLLLAAGLPGSALTLLVPPQALVDARPVQRRTLDHLQDLGVTLRGSHPDPYAAGQPAQALAEMAHTLAPARGPAAGSTVLAGHTAGVGSQAS